MSDPHNQDEHRRVFHFVENSIVPDADAVAVLAALELLHQVRAWVVRECLDLPVDAPKKLDLPVDAPKNVAGEGVSN